jgi:nitrite reductase (NO-forming)
MVTGPNSPAHPSGGETPHQRPRPAEAPEAQHAASAPGGSHAVPPPAAAANPKPTQAAAQAIGMPSHGDPAAGQKVFRKCQACHSLEAGKNLVGPSLAGIIGRKAGTEPGFNYSPAMKQADITWTPQTLAAYLADPQKTVPGNRMPFPGLKSEHDRDDVIALLVQNAAQGEAATPSAAAPGPALAPTPAQTNTLVASPPPVTHGMPDMPDVKYTLRSGIAEGRMVFIGVGGAIDGQVNPVLAAAEGQTVQVTLIAGVDLALPRLGLHFLSPRLADIHQLGLAEVQPRQVLHARSAAFCYVA